MLKRMLHAANQVVVHSETHTGTRALTIKGTVNDEADMLAVKGDSWQLQQEQGKNLLNPDELEIGGLTGNNGTDFTASNRIRTGFIPVEEGTKYIFSGYEALVNAHIYDSSKTRIAQFNFRMAITSGGKYIRASFKKSTGEDFTEEELQDLKSTLMIEAGDTATPYEPFTPTMPSPEYPSEVMSVEGEMQSCGWNLWDKGDVEGIRHVRKFISIQPGTYLVMADVESDNTDGNTCLAAFYCSDGSYKSIQFDRKERCGRILAIDKPIVYIYFYASLSYSKSNGDAFYFKNIQIVKGTTPKPYDRHRGNAITLPVLRSLPDGTADMLYVDRRNKRAWVERCVGVAVFDGSEDENWKVDSNNGFRIAVSEMKNGKMLDGYCNRFRSNIGFSLQCIMFGYNSSILYFPETLDIADTLEAWKSWLSSNPVTVQYPLAEPIIEELEYSDYLLETAQYETNLRIDCDEHLEPEISATVKVLGR